MKKILSLLICVVLIGSAFAMVSFAAVPDGSIVMPKSNNTQITNSTFEISSNGLAIVTTRFVGFSGVTTGGRIVTRLEKLENGVWVTVNIGTQNNEWVDQSSTWMLNATHSFQLTSHGTYRAVVEYRVWGNGGAEDVIPATIEKTY